MDSRSLHFVIVGFRRAFCTAIRCHCRRFVDVYSGNGSSNGVKVMVSVGIQVPSIPSSYLRRCVEVLPKTCGLKTRFHVELRQHRELRWTERCVWLHGKAERAESGECG